MLWKPLVVVEAVVWCVLCVLVAICGVVPVCCAVRCSVTVAVGCCCCGRVVVVGTRGGAGNVVGSSLSSRAVVGEVAAVRAAVTQTVGGLEEEEEAVGVSAIAVVASMAETCLVEDVSEGHVELPVAKARAAC